MNKKFSDSELNELCANNLISPEQAKNISEYYNSTQKQHSNNALMNIFISIGAILIGLGIIIFFAINWNDIPTTAKLIISLLPTILGLIGAFYVIDKDHLSNYKTGISAYLPLAITGTFALINQIYNFNIELPNFLFISIIAFIPFMLILKETPGIILYSLVSLGVICLLPSINTLEYCIKTLILSIPIIGIFLANFKDQKQSFILNFTFTIISAILTIFLDRLEIIKDYEILSLIGIIYLLSTLIFDKNTFVTRIVKFFIIGSTFICAINENFAFNSKDSTIFLFILPIISLCFFASKSFYTNLDAILITLMANIPMILGKLSEQDIFIFTLANLLIITWGIVKILNGYSNNKVSEAVAGVAYIISIILIRFFNSDIDLTIKSVLFIAFGIIFIIVSNYFKNQINRKIGDSIENK